MLSDDELRALADRVRYAATFLMRPGTPSIYWNACNRAADYLRACADAKPVAIVGEQRNGAWAGTNTPVGYVWSPPSDNSTKMLFPLADLPLGTKLYTHPAPAAPQAMEDANVWKQIVPDDEPQAEPKREALTDAILAACKGTKERAAKACEALAFLESNSHWSDGFNTAIERCAAAIRALGGSMTEIVGTLLARFRCWRRGHSMHVNDVSRRDETGYLRWPCQRCGQVQRLPYGLAANGRITDQRIKGRHD